MQTFREYLIAEAKNGIMKADYLDRKAKMAKKDYDKDGKIETSKEEYKGSIDKAIKKTNKKNRLHNPNYLSDNANLKK